MSDDYEVGYKRPPKQTQFKSGKSGNPSGRPKKRRTLQRIIEEASNRKVTIRQGGREVKVAWTEAMVQQLFIKAMSGHLGSIKLVLSLVSSLSRPEGFEIDLEDQAAFDEFVEELRKETEDHGQAGTANSAHVPDASE